MPVFFIPSDIIQGQTLTLRDPLYTHIYKSLRVRPGDLILVGDEQRRRHQIKITKITNTQLMGTIEETLPGPPVAPTQITLAQTILKGEKMNWSIQKATELGVATIAPLLTERTTVRLERKQASHHQERWQRIALEAAQQCERWDIPTILAPQAFGHFVDDLPTPALKLLLTEREASSESVLSSVNPKIYDKIIVGVGPEGGWTEGEVTVAEAAGFTKVSLGQMILRAETAAFVALVMVQGRLGQLTFGAIAQHPNTRVAS